MSKFPSAFVVIPFALFCMLTILAIAVAADCVRLDNVARGVVDLADQDLLAFELRMIQSLKSSSSMPGETKSAISDHDLAKDPTERHSAYLRLAKIVESTAADNQDSRFLEDVRGIANRWSVSNKMYQAHVDELYQYRQSRRGEIASWFIRW